MLVFPNAKINLGLHVVSKRADGFHNIESCFYPVQLCDILEFIQTGNQTTFHSTGLNIPGEAAENLCIRAWEMIHTDFGIPPVEIHLHKQIPIGAGLGGGSADAAFMLRTLNEQFNLQLETKQLKHYAARLGSDCSFFIENMPAIASGRGEILEPVELSLAGYKLVLVNPGIHVSTREAFAGLKPREPKHRLSEIIGLEPERWQNLLVNDFEETVFAVYPEIEAIKQEFVSMGAVYTSMSGSGSTVYALFRDKILHDINEKFKGYFVWAQT